MQPSAPVEHAEQTAERDAHQLVGAKRFEVLAAVLVVMFFSSMASTVVSTAMPNIISDLNGLSLYAWVFTAYMLGAAIVVPIYGKLSDIFGRKPLYVVGIGLYLIGNIVAGFAQNMEMLVAARAIAGLGGGGMQALSQITIGDIFTPQERGRWIGVMMSAFGLASIIGPTVGGWLTDGPGWRWVFWFNIPVGLVALAGLLYALPTVRQSRKVSIDYLGIATLAVGLVPALLAITWLGDNYTWDSPRVLIGFLLTLLVLPLFVWREFKADDPLVSPALFQNKIFVAAMGASFCLALGMFGSIMFVPLFVQGVIGNSAQDSGVILTPMMLSFIVGSFISGQLVSRWGRYRVQAIVGLVIGALGMFLFSRMSVSTGSDAVIRNMIVLGVGIGSTMPLFTIAVQNAFPYRVLGTVTSARQFFTSLGGVIGVPVMGALLNSGFSSNFARHLSPGLQALAAKPHGLGSLNPTTLISAEAQAAIRGRFLHLGPSGPALYHQFLFAVRDGLALTMQTLFQVGLVFMIAAVIVSFFLKEIPLRTSHSEPEQAIIVEAADISGAPEPVIAPEPQL